jgi:hypothetical protein
MSKRLQVLLDEKEYAEVQTLAREHGMTTADWVRDAIRRAKRAYPRGNAQRKLESVDRAMSYEFPTAEIGQMLGEIEEGYGTGLH